MDNTPHIMSTYTMLVFALCGAGLFALWREVVRLMPVPVYAGRGR
jgi:hypothetical protein